VWWKCALRANDQDQPPFVMSDLFKVVEYNRDIDLGPGGFSPTEGNLHSYDSRSRLWSADNPPSADGRSLSLDEYLASGATLYHEYISSNRRPRTCR
jgi:hypothetical protein